MDQFCCMVMRINIDCNGCYRKVRRALLDIQGQIKCSCFFFSSEFLICFFIYVGNEINAELDTHLIEMKQSKVSVCGRFKPQEIAIKIRKKTNRRVEILEVQEFGSSNDEQSHGEKPFMITSWNLESNQNQSATCR
ncbi:hypothetical protein GQ457_04G012410 [Hibiscus cannabinus]